MEPSRDAIHAMENYKVHVTVLKTSSKLVLSVVCQGTRDVALCKCGTTVSYGWHNCHD
jgi:hypothetical protein